MWNLVYVNDNCGEIIIWIEMERSDMIHNGGMDGEDEGTCRDGQTDTLD